MRFRIKTAYGTVYEIDKDGCFLRYGNHTFEHPHDSWKCTGIAKQLPFGHFRRLSLETFIAMMNARYSKWTFKNGKPRFTLTDIDHGTHRIHGNTRCHGIAIAYAL